MYFFYKIIYQICPYCEIVRDEHCLVSTGNCLHRFHKHCIDSWVNQTFSTHTCPLDREEWIERWVVNPQNNLINL